MRLRTLALIPTLAAAMLSISTGGASAVTLFTTPAHTTRVPVGATATLTTQDGLRMVVSGVATCAHAQVGIRISQNNDTLAIADTINGSITGCTFSVPTPTFPATSRITFGARLTIPPYTAAVTQWDRYVVDYFSSTYTGNLTTRITTTEPLAGGPICVTLDYARTLTTPGPSTATIDANYCFTGAAATWSFT